MATKEKKEKKKLSFPELIRAMWGPYLQLLPYLKPYWKRFVIGLLCGAGAGLVSGLLVFVIKHVSDTVFGAGGHAQKMGPMAFFQHDNTSAATNEVGDINAVIWTCALIPGVMMLRSILTYLNAYCVSWVSLRLLHDIRNDLFGKVVTQSLDFFNKSQSGQLISRVVNDSRMAQAALTQVGSDLVTQPFTILGALVALLYLDPKFTFFSLVLFPICLVPITIFGRRVRRGGADEEQGTGVLMTVLHEALTGIRVVKALSREQDEIRDFKAAGEQQFRIAIRVRKAIAAITPVIEAISAIGVGMALLYVWKMGIPAGRFLGLMAGLFMLYDPVKKLSRIHMMIQKALGATQRIFKLMETQPTVANLPGAAALPPARGEITFENVTFAYRPDIPAAVREISLHIEPGKTYALVGASGSGKSTLMALLLRFYDPQQGVIRIDGQNIREVTQESLRQQIAIVSQDTFLFHTTIRENIRYGRLDATDEEVQLAAEQAFAHDFICAQPQGYETVVGDKGCNLSGGQQQRIAIARALLRNAPILLLDEATSALDSESEQKIQLALERLSEGRTVIAIAHRLSTILKADQIVAMQHGQIMEMGTHAELFARSGHYRHLYDLQFNRHTEEAAAAEEASRQPSLDTPATAPSLP